MVPIFKGKGDIWNCCCYLAVELLEHGMKVVERLRRIVTVDFAFTIDAVFILGRLQEDYHAKGKSIYVFCGPRESF